VENEQPRTHPSTGQDDQSVPSPNASHNRMDVIAGLHLYTAPKGSSRAIAVMIISIHSLYDPERNGLRNREMDVARGGNPSIGFHHPVLSGTQARIKRDDKPNGRRTFPMIRMSLMLESGGFTASAQCSSLSIYSGLFTNP